MRVLALSSVCATLLISTARGQLAVGAALPPCWPDTPRTGSPHQNVGGKGVERRCLCGDTAQPNSLGLRVRVCLCALCVRVCAGTNTQVHLVSYLLSVV